MHIGLECLKHNNPADCFLDMITKQEKEYDEEKEECMWCFYLITIMCRAATKACVVMIIPVGNISSLYYVLNILRVVIFTVVKNSVPTESSHFAAKFRSSSEYAQLHDKLDPIIQTALRHPVAKSSSFTTNYFWQVRASVCHTHTLHACTHIHMYAHACMNTHTLLLIL